MHGTAKRPRDANVDLQGVALVVRPAAVAQAVSEPNESDKERAQRLLLEWVTAVRAEAWRRALSTEAELARLRPVVEAAKAWYGVEADWRAVNEVSCALVAAVDACLAAEGK